MKEESYENACSNQLAPNMRIVTEQIGVWYLNISESNGIYVKNYWNNIVSSVPLFRKLAMEIYHLDPILFIAFVCSKMWSGLESAFLTYMSGQVLREIEAGISHSQPSMGPVITAISYRLACLVLAAYISWWTDNRSSVMKSKVQAHFEYLLMKANLRIDLPTSKDPANKTTATASEAWYAFDEIVDFLTTVLEFLSQLFLIVNISSLSGSPLFSVLCAVQPIMSVLGSRTLWDKACLAYVNNPYYERMKAMQQLSTEEYRQDIISADLSEHILNEYTEAHNRLGNVLTDHPFYIYGQRPKPWFDIVHYIAGDLPMIYCAVNAIRNPSSLSLSTIATLQQSSYSIRYSLERMLRNEQMFRKNINTIRNIYAASDVRTTITSGSLSYPLQEKLKRGMSFKLSNVSFQYPGSKKVSNALSNINLVINPGELVVIVGSNGSGKSTLIRILARLYDPTSGAVLIDGEPAKSYKVADLHKATAILSQDNHIYPVSLGENIGLGYPKCSGNKEMITLAAERGGASEFISKLGDGMDTILEPSLDPFVHNVGNDKDHPLQKQLEALQKKLEISGGEKQRLVAARTFMRFNSGSVNFVAVDEPSSALDAEGELHLFEQLIKMREGKTMIFVTHRFGYLTRHADKIICMKDGVIVETGTHQELMKLSGEYANLYDIQASAFLSEQRTIDSKYKEEASV